MTSIYKFIKETHLEVTGINRRNMTDIHSFVFPLYNENTFYVTNGLVSIINTDYENYAVIYGCFDIWGKNIYSAAILARNKSLPKETIKSLQEYITKVTGLKTFRFVEQSDVIDKKNYVFRRKFKFKI
jgi:hypothetical protein